MIDNDIEALKQVEEVLQIEYENVHIIKVALAKYDAQSLRRAFEPIIGVKAKLFINCSNRRRSAESENKSEALS